MNLVVDYGNTYIKAAVFKSHKLAEQFTFKGRHDLQHFLQNFSGRNFILSSVTHENKEVLDWAPQVENKLLLDAALPLPVVNLYETPHTLGSDRIAGVCGAKQEFPAHNCLVIDTGTCIKYDFLDSGGRYHGGGISPGLRMRFEAMHHFTARLPLVETTDNPPLIGKSTVASMQSGAINGALAEIEGIIARYEHEFEGLKVILTGGDSAFFENNLKRPIFALPNLVLSGLNSILIHNVGD